MFLLPATRREHRHYLRYRRRRRLLMVAVLLLLTGAAIAVLHSHGHDRRTATHRGHDAHHLDTHARHASRPQLANSPATAGQGLSWIDFHGIQLPTSAQDGPRSTTGGLAQGFTDTPRGALLAAINIGVRAAALWGPAIYTPTITHQVTGPDAAALLNTDTNDYKALRDAAGAGSGPYVGRAYAVEAAYRFVAWSPADATVDVVTEGPGNNGATVLAATRIEVVWQHADWRLVAPPGGKWANSAASIPSLTGYITFPGER